MVELAAIDERQEDQERSMLKDVLKQLRKEREEEHERLTKKCNKIGRKRVARASETEPRTRGLHTLVGKRIGATALRHG